jgi:Na+:H+ antiporter, NhaC family
MEPTFKKPSLIQALTPIVVLILLLMVSVMSIWGSDSLSGANQMALLFATAIAALIGWRLKYKWKDMLSGISDSILSALPALLILLLIGALAGTWLISGIVPSMIYYGLKILNPTIFLFAACIVSAIISLATGSSWTTIATIGVALLGIGQAMDIHTGLIAGAIISGAYFGDKMSPMSDTTNLAPAVAGTDLFTHIRYMMWTTIPSIVITLLIFLVIGFFVGEGGSTDEINGILSAIEGSFQITPWLFLVPLAVIFMIIKKVPAIPALFAGALLGGVAALVFQPEIINQNGIKSTVMIGGENASEYTFEWYQDGEKIEGDSKLKNQNGGTYELVISKEAEVASTGTFIIPEALDTSAMDNFTLTFDNSINKLGLTATLSRSNYLEASYRSVINAMTVDTSVNTSSSQVNKLLGTNGMSGMMGTIWLIICAMSFGGILDKLGMLSKITEVIVSKAKSRGSLIATTTLTCIGFNVTASDQYLAIVVPGKMFSKTYGDRGLAPQNLSRTLEDSGTVTSVLVPWNTCGAAQSHVLGVATGEYFLFCFFNIISPIMTIIYGYLGIKIARLNEKKDV